MHLTNFSVNKDCSAGSGEGEEDWERGTKWSLAMLWRHLAREGLLPDHRPVWAQIQVNGACI